MKPPDFKKELGFTTTPERSAMMKKMRSTNTVPEIMLRKALWKKGVRYRLNVKTLPGKPDLVIKRYKIAIFVDGEFWHGYNWENLREKIISNRGYWIPKIERNMERDKHNNASLAFMGYTVLRFWVKEIRKDLEGCISIILSRLPELT